MISDVLSNWRLFDNHRPPLGVEAYVRRRNCREIVEEIYVDAYRLLLDGISVLPLPWIFTYSFAVKGNRDQMEQRRIYHRDFLDGKEREKERLLR